MTPLASAPTSSLLLGSPSTQQPLLSSSSPSSLFQQTRSVSFDQQAMAELNKNRKLYKPPAAKDLIAMVKPIVVNDSTVMCCGDESPELGHPVVFINLENPGLNACGYCGQTFIWSKYVKE
eukprot:CAMPEP_0201521788 /NCGR_PEP_ID=MMETSP0161_2-20130828/16257_1 /ASSEMBLY_ACC=CAM_ASM_000251 /TAXON_ID=180227 /ORGANISM="Neoparamoeba aestuarina, Strain SoJaBio B1-5/56/2" /LENGTH=120 /DNA_ID=CAMNT_0047920497 /DNA_START=177 /DNA_END=539 /DNA_ORIENTATION=+